MQHNRSGTPTPRINRSMPCNDYSVAIGPPTDCEDAQTRTYASTYGCTANFVSTSVRLTKRYYCTVFVIHTAQRNSGFKLSNLQLAFGMAGVPASVWAPLLCTQWHKQRITACVLGAPQI